MCVYVYTCAYMCIHAMLWLWKSENKLQELLALSFYYVDFSD